MNSFRWCNFYLVMADGTWRCGEGDTCQWQSRKSQNQWATRGTTFPLLCYYNPKLRQSGPFMLIVNAGSCQSLFHLGTNEAKPCQRGGVFLKSIRAEDLNNIQWPDITIASLNASVLNQSRHPKGLWKDVLRGSTIGRSLIVPLWLFC